MKNRWVNSFATKLLYFASAISTLVTIMFLWSFTSERDNLMLGTQTILEPGEFSASALRFSDSEQEQPLPFLALPGVVSITSEGQESYEMKDFDLSVETSAVVQNTNETADSETIREEVLFEDTGFELTTAEPGAEDTELGNEKTRLRDSYDSRLNIINRFCSRNPDFGSNMMRANKMNGKRTNSWISFTTPVLSTLGSTLTVHEQENLRKLNLEWCPVFKAASSPWMAVLMRIKHRLTARTEAMIKNGEMTFVKLARLFHMTVDEVASSGIGFSKLNDSESGRDTNVKMLVVRNPFERLLSAYRDKLERISGRQYYHRRFGLPIIRRFRFHKNWEEAFSVPLLRMRQDPQFNGSTGDEANVDNVVFTERVFARVSSVRPESTAGPRHRHWDLVPTFNEFVQYLLATAPEDMDEHWRPVYIDCNACSNNFNLILKVETMERDKDYVLNDLMGMKTQSAGLEFNGVNTVWRRWANTVVNLGILNKTSENTDGKPVVGVNRSKYFSQVSKDDLKALFKLYEPDFVMFGYDETLQEYIDLGR